MHALWQILAEYWIYASGLSFFRKSSAQVHKIKCLASWLENYFLSTLCRTDSGQGIIRFRRDEDEIMVIVQK